MSLKSKLSRADKLKLALRQLHNFISADWEMLSNVLLSSSDKMKSGNNDMRDDSVLLNRSPSHVRQPQGEANAVR